MKVVCSWCQTNQPDKAPFDDQSITHGMCDDCFAELAKEVDLNRPNNLYDKISTEDILSLEA